MAKIKTGPKVVLVVLGVLGVFYGLKKSMEYGWIKTPGVLVSVVPQKAVLPNVQDAQVQNVEPVAMPSSSPASISAPVITAGIWEWNAQAGMIYANGGAHTTHGSLMEKHGVNLTLLRQDDTGKMGEGLVKCAQERANGANSCSTGYDFVDIMGDGSGQFIAGLNPQLAKLGPSYKLIVVGSTGYSRGEDAFMAPSNVKSNAQSFRDSSMPGSRDSKGSEVHGLLIDGVLRDGDWNIALKWAGDNNIKNNPDEKTFDPDAINWINATDYNVAASDYVAGKCEDRKVARDGKLTGETVHVCVNAVVTWTPGDVTIAKQKGGLVKVVSSKQYRSQMPCVIIGTRDFFSKNRTEVQGMLAAIFEGGDQVKAFDSALHKASAISATLYADQDEAYWYKYFKGSTEKDAQGLTVELGGSAVNNLADNLILFGLQPGSNDNFRSTYSVFRNIVLQQYPALFKDTPIPPASEVEDADAKSYITGAQALMSSGGSSADVPSYSEQEGGQKVSQRSYSITFDTDKATFTSAGIDQMKQLKDSLAITGLFITVDGYTDNTGNEPHNQDLSERRAQAVRSWLQSAASSNFPSSRFAIHGHGSSNPTCTNSSPECRAANRRVEITLSGN